MSCRQPRNWDRKCCFIVNLICGVVKCRALSGWGNACQEFQDFSTGVCTVYLMYVTVIDCHMLTFRTYLWRNQQKKKNDQCWSLLPNTENFGYIQGWIYSMLRCIQALLYSHPQLFYVSVTKLWLYSFWIYSITGYIQTHSLTPASFDLLLFFSYILKSLHIFKLCLCLHSTHISYIYIYIYREREREREREIFLETCCQNAELKIVILYKER